MILLPTRRRLLRRRDALYQRLAAVVQCGSIHQVESIMRQIHSINLKLRTYFIRAHEPKEVFPDEEENYDIAPKNPFTINTL